MVHGAPQCWVWALSLCFLHLILSTIALALFLFLLKIFESFGFFFMPPSFVWAPLID